MSLFLTIRPGPKYCKIRTCLNCVEVSEETILAQQFAQSGEFLKLKELKDLLAQYV